MGILFCKIAEMKYYKGINENDMPGIYGGSFVRETGEAHEEFNFLPVMAEDGREYCYGFVETKGQNNKRNQLHIENIDGCGMLKEEERASDVLVIWCATTALNETSVIGWYKHADVFRFYQEIDFSAYTSKYYDGIKIYNILANKEDCVLLPKHIRHNYIWNAPVPKSHTYGFGQSMLWYAGDEKAKTFINRLVNNINEYSGENWV